MLASLPLDCQSSVILIPSILTRQAKNSLYLYATLVYTPPTYITTTTRGSEAEVVTGWMPNKQHQRTACRAD